MAGKVIRFLKKALVTGAAGAIIYAGGCAGGLSGKSPTGRWLDYDGMDRTEFYDGSCDIQINGHTQDGYACSLVVRDVTRGVADDLMATLNEVQFFTVDKPGKGYRVATLRGREVVEPLKYIGTRDGVHICELGDLDKLRTFRASRIEDGIEGRVAGIKADVGKVHNEAVDAEVERLKEVLPGEVAD